ncbi:MAG: hypothetical protein KAW45_00295 [Thermoplasmatales archaeon]|nr:hypothetical protein [Thermoplasmatales archaeon]
MEKKPTNIYILLILWIGISIIFSGILIIHTLRYLDTLSFHSGSISELDLYISYSFILYLLLYLGIIILSAVSSYGTLFNKKWSWLIGIMFSSFLGYHVFLGIYMVGIMIINESFDNIFTDIQTGFQYIGYIFLIFLIPTSLFILTRKEVRAYFGK